MTALHEQITAMLAQAPDRETGLKSALAVILAHFRSETGTIHSLDPDKQVLHLIAQVGLPPAMLDIVRLIPAGKGIAGQVVSRGGPVTICNLQTDTSGVAKPGARQTGVGGALCVPVRRGETMIGTLGIGTARPYEYTPDETKALEDIGRLIGEQVKLFE